MVATVTESIVSKDVQFQQWITRWGCSTSEAILEAHCEFFTTPGIEGFIGYRQEKGTAVVFGDPICSKENARQLALTFQKFCDKQDLKVIYMLASEPFANWAIENISKVMIEVCEELVFDPQEDPTLGHKAHRLRNKIHHVQHLDVNVHEYEGGNPKLEVEMQRVGDSWLESRKGPQIYLGPVRLFNNRVGKRWFYIQDNEGNVTSVALLRKVDAQNGWFIKFLVTQPSAPRGTSELLMNSILETLRKEQCPYLSVGMVPASQLGIIHGLGKFYKSLARNLFSLAKWIFHLEHRKLYWQQFHPTEYRSFILFSKPNVGIKDVRAIMNALNVNV